LLRCDGRRGEGGSRRSLKRRRPVATGVQTPIKKTV